MSFVQLNHTADRPAFQLTIFPLGLQDDRLYDKRVIYYNPL